MTPHQTTPVRRSQIYVGKDHSGRDLAKLTPECEAELDRRKAAKEKGEEEQK